MSKKKEWITNKEALDYLYKLSGRKMTKQFLHNFAKKKRIIKYQSDGYHRLFLKSEIEKYAKNCLIKPDTKKYKRIKEISELSGISYQVTYNLFKFNRMRINYICYNPEGSGKSTLYINYEQFSKIIREYKEECNGRKKRD